MSNSKSRIRGVNDSSIVLGENRDLVKVELHVKGGRMYCHLRPDEAIEFANAIESKARNINSKNGGNL